MVELEELPVLGGSGEAGGQLVLDGVDKFLNILTSVLFDKDSGHTKSTIDSILRQLLLW